MTATIKEQLEKVLSEIESVGDIELSAIVSRHGLLMVSKTTREDSDSEAFAALTATLHMSAESTTRRLSNAIPESIVVETPNKHLITYSAGPNALIVVLAGNTGNLGLILNALRKASEKVKQII